MALDAHHANARKLVLTVDQLLEQLDVEAAIRVGAGSCAGLTLPNGWALQRVLDDVSSRWERAREECGGIGFLDLPDVQLVVLLMHVACHPTREYHRLVAATWPSFDDVRASMPLFYTAELLDAMRGTHTARIIAEV